MRNAVRAHDRQRRIEPPLHQGRHLVERAAREHGVEPRVDALAELRTIWREIEARPFAGAKRRRRARAEERDERTPRRSEHLERAQDALPVAGIEARGGLGIARHELVVKLGRGAALRLASNLSPHGFGHGRDVRQALGQRAEIKPGAADENNRPFADVRQNLARGKRPPAGGKIDRAVDRAEQAMRREPLLVRRRPRGQDSRDPGRLASNWR